MLKNLKKSDLLILSGLICFVIIIYSRTFTNGFVNWDDDLYLGNNYIKYFTFSFIHIKGIFTSNVLGNYNPITVLIYGIENHFFKNHPEYYHIVNLVIHIINIALVYYLILELSGKSGISLIAACLFGIHPMHVESVAWVSDIKDLLFTLFYLVALIFYLKYIKENQQILIKVNENKTNKTSATYFILSVIFYIFSLLSKSSAITFPLILFLIDYFYRYPDYKKRVKINSENYVENETNMDQQNTPSGSKQLINSNYNYLIKCIIEKIAFLVLAVLFAYINYKFQNEIGVVHNSNNVFHPFNRIFISTHALCFYFTNFIFPINLCAVHPFPVENNNILPWQYYLSLPLLLLMLFIILIFFRYKAKQRSLSNKNEELSTDYKALIFGLLFFFINILLVIQIIPFGLCIVSERYSYLPYIGLSYIAGIIFYFILNALQTEVNRIKKNFRNIFVIIFICYLIFLSLSSFERNKVWENGNTLFTDVINKFPGYYLAYNNRGLLKMLNYDYQGAINDFSLSILKNPNDYVSYNSRGEVYMKLKKYNEALDDFSVSIAINPNYVNSLNNRGAIKFINKDYSGAMEDYNKAANCDQNSYQVFLNRGILKQIQYDLRGAILDYNKVINLYPQFPDVYKLKGNAEYMLGYKLKACKEWNTALKLGCAEAKDLIIKFCNNN